MNLTPEFTTSYQQFESYPEQLIYNGSYLSALQASRSRLEEAAPDLLTQDDSNIHIPFRDLEPNETPKKQNVLSDAALKEWLGDQSTIDAQTSNVLGELATKKDPKCRFIYFWAGDSRQPLKLTRKTLARILTYHQVMPKYLDFLYIFGRQDRPRDLRFSGFREQTLLSSPPRGPAVPALGRSGRQFQLCYNVKAPFLKRVPKREWSIRQAAVHHQFDVVEGTTLWIVTKGDQELKQRIERMTGPDGRAEDRNFTTSDDCFKSSLAVHLLLCHWSTEEWRWYIQALEDIIDRSTHDAVDAPRDRDHPQRVYEPNDLLALQGHADEINQAIMIMEANIDVLTALRRYYEGLLRHKDFAMKKTCREEILTFANQVNDMIYDLKMQVSRAKVLILITADRKTIIVQHLGTQATASMEKLTMSMYDMGVVTRTETVAMRIITVVTLLYLPATFVSTFFSTDIVKYQNQNNGNSTSRGEQGSDSSFSLVALERWLEVTLPLTLITLVMAFVFFRRSVRKYNDTKGATIETLPLYYQSVWKA